MGDPPQAAGPSRPAVIVDASGRRADLESVAPRLAQIREDLEREVAAATADLAFVVDWYFVRSVAKGVEDYHAAFQEREDAEGWLAEHRSEWPETTDLEVVGLDGVRHG